MTQKNSYAYLFLTDEEEDINHEIEAQSLRRLHIEIEDGVVLIIVF
ncbi:MAG: hypothetical protein FWH01_08570 [Oscillospiraceae bacterium]|nr:hypothetical protein [Oscillospiraceae bacterium]